MGNYEHTFCTRCGLKISETGSFYTDRHNHPICDNCYMPAVIAGYVKRQSATYRVNLIFRPGSLWVGAHWSAHNQRLCINLIPCVTLAITWPDGTEPQ